MPDPEVDRESVGPMLKKVRVEAGVSRRDIAQKLGCSISTIARLETGKTMATDEMINRLKALTLLGEHHRAAEGVGEALGATGGVVAGIGGATTAVSAAGIPGLSAAGMTSGLAALGLGSMATGIGVVAAIPVALGLAGYGVVKGLKTLVEANNLECKEVDDLLEIRVKSVN